MHAFLQMLWAVKKKTLSKSKPGRGAKKVRRNMIFPELIRFETEGSDDE